MRIGRPTPLRLALPVLLLVTGVLGAQVQIIRQLPPTGEHTVDAQWGTATPSQQTSPTAGVQLGGRLSAGTTGGINELGAQTLDAFVDSNLSFLVPLGGSSKFLVTGEALRKPRLDGLEQSYKAGATFTFDAWQADIGGAFRQQDRADPTSSSSDMTGDAHAAVTLGFIPTLPVSFAYAFQRLAQSQTDSLGQASPARDEGSHKAELKASGTLGTVGVDSGASFSSVTDYASGAQTTGFGGTFGVTVPIASFLKVYGTVVPRYDATAYAATGNSTSAASVASELGVILPATTALSFKVGAGMLDLWTSQAGPFAGAAAPPFTLTGRGIAGVEWKQDTGLSASGTYSLGAAQAGPLIHSVDADLGFHGKQDALVKDAGASGTWTLSVDPTGAPVDSHAGWKTSVALGSQDALALAASYTGSVDGVSSQSWSNSGHAAFSHQVAPWFSYGMGADLSGAASAASTPTFDQSYQGKLTFTPRIADRTFTFGLGETLALAVLASPAQAVSKADAEIQAPIFSFLGTRYRFDWEWDAQTAPGAGPDSSFHHTFGLTLSGQPLPFSLGVEYGLTHGFRGLRHDVNASLSVALMKGLSVQGSLTLSEYDVAGTPAVPFLATLNAAYQF